MTRKKRILFLMSDTGGGHRAAAEAIRDAMIEKYGAENIEAELVDVYKNTRFPLYYMPEFYPWWVSNAGATWGMSYNLSNTPRRAKVIAKWVYFSNMSRLDRMVKRHEADVVVCVHSFIARPSMDAFLRLPKRPPFVTVVTDLVSTHMFWYDKYTEACLTPTQAAYDRGLQCGMNPDKMRDVGLPVHPNFSRNLLPKEDARKELEWSEKPTILLVAGGDGMGALDNIAHEINQKNLDCQLAIVAGRNKELREKLEATNWNQETHVYGFVENMPKLMAAADMVVTKAGPATISEACIAGLPIILCGMVPGQEDGNVTFVTENGAGVYEPNPTKIAQTLEQWLGEGTEGLERRSAAARKLARPDAVWEIAEEVWYWAHQPKIANPPRRFFRQFARRTRQFVSTIL